MAEVRHFARGILMFVLVTLVQFPLVMVAFRVDVPVLLIWLFVELRSLLFWWYAAIGRYGRVTFSRFLICALIWLIPIVGPCADIYWAGKSLTLDERKTAKSLAATISIILFHTVISAQTAAWSDAACTAFFISS